MQRVVQIGTQRYTVVKSIDEPGIGGAHHEYSISSQDSSEELTRISFQNGPIKEAGINGCHNEDLIAIVIDRLQSFQQSQFVCRENAIAITKLEEALLWLGKRTKDREKRGVEGTHTV